MRRSLGSRARDSVPSLNGQLLDKCVLFVDASFERVIHLRALEHACVAESFWHSSLQILHFGELRITHLARRTLFHQRLLISKVRSLLWGDLIFLDLEAGTQKLLLHSLNVFAFAQAHFNFSNACTNVSDLVLVNDSLDYVFNTRN
jgi:hypothetical protein